ncbi:hypothetical protein BDW02DRAFT_386683 [Decorospora gaudefroyi]|uniref:Mating-type protein MAT-1 n=1 Tax=Decorospora gaudefroyi TaxID=184978 RepID=A0A6A5KV78_9PLEO|nr:hypothetical protein BDW02DRAFT_386683 [Decorospora gaudefroyi]
MTMNTETFLAQAPVGEVALSTVEKDAMSQIQTALDACIEAWNRGDDVLLLKVNLPELFGEVMLTYFKRCLHEVAGETADLTIVDAGDSYHTLISMPQNAALDPQVQPSVPSPPMQASEQTTLDIAGMAAGLKKAPRPMNCWIIFRDSMHKKLKVENPHLTVQEISTRCSQIWHSLSPADKKPWRAAAQSAKEEHLRQHPDYKYTPRKPGQKKKRQSLKAKRAAAAAAAGREVLNVQLLSEVTAAPAIAMNNTIAAVGNAFVDALPQFNAAPDDFLSTSMASNMLFPTETLRHEQLAAEFGNGIDVHNSFALVDYGMLSLSGRGTSSLALCSSVQQFASPQTHKISSTKKPRALLMPSMSQEMALERVPTDTEMERYLLARDGKQIESFIYSRSGEQMARLVQGISDPMAQAVFTATLLRPAPRPKSGRFTTSEKAKGKPKAKKVLNAFVGFRCYYITIPTFKQWPMKKLSSLVGLLWEADPNKSLWSLLAKAWSSMRDQIGKENTPLDEYFAFICPFLKMPPPEMYLELHGWTLITDNEGNPTLSRDTDFEPTSVSAELAHMALSVEDIIKACQDKGYAQFYVANANTTSATFLGHTVPMDKSNVAEVPTVMSVAEAREDARNRLQERREICRETGLPELEQDIAMAHATATLNDSQREAAYYAGVNPVYHAFANLMAGNFPDGTVDISFPLNVIEETSMDDWTAFRRGADELATLPSFDDAINP